METHTDLGTFDGIMAGKSPEVVSIAVRLREIIAGLHPAAVEVPRAGDNAISYGVGPKKMSEAYTYIMPLKDRVNLGFYHGVALPDPHQLLEGTGKRLRHVKVRTLVAANAPELQELLAAARQEREQTLGNR